MSAARLAAPEWTSEWVRPSSKVASTPMATPRPLARRMPAASPSRDRLIGRRLSIRSNRPLMRCGPGTSMRAGTTRGQFGRPGPTEPDTQAAENGSDEGGRQRQGEQADVSSTEFLPREQSQTGRDGGNGRSRRVRPQETGKAGGGRPEQQHDQPAWVSQTISFGGPQEAEGRRQIKAASANPGQDRVDVSLQGRVVSDLLDRLEDRALPPERDSHTAIGDSDVQRLRRECLRGCRQYVEDFSGRLVVFEQESGRPQAETRSVGDRSWSTPFGRNHP